jgi:hypothetical protein
MATDASTDGWNAGRCGSLRLGVAVHARNLEVTRVDSVAKINGLPRRRAREKRRVRPVTESQPDETDPEHQRSRREHF